MDISLVYKIAAFVIASRTIDYILDKRKKLPVDLPVNELLQLTGFLRYKHEVICFADTNHTDLHVQALLGSADLASGLKIQGFDHSFTEDPTYEQELTDKLKAGDISRKEFVDQYTKKNHGNDWCGPNIGKQMAAQLARIITESGQSLHHVDARWKHVDKIPANKETMLWKTAKFSVRLAHRTARFCFPKSPIVSHVFVIIAGLLTRSDPKYLKFFMDDSIGAKEIAIFMDNVPGKQAVVTYGAGHFNGSAEELGMRGMDRQLKELGLNPVVVNIYPNKNARVRYYRCFKGVERTNPHFRSPHVDFIVRPADGQHVYFTSAKQEAAFREFCAKDCMREIPALGPGVAPAFS